MAQIDYFFSVLSPFTYLAGDALEKIALPRAATIVHKPMDIAAVFAETGGTPLPKRHPSRQSYRLQDMARLAKMSGLPITLQPAHFPTNPRPASVALIAAQAAGFSVAPAARALLAAVWAEEKDAAEPSVIEAALTDAGVSPATIAPHLADAEATFDANTREAIERGVFGSPFYLVGEERFWGQDRLPHLAAHLDA